MKHLVWRTILWTLLLVPVGTGRLLWQTARTIVGFRPQTLLMFVGLAVALSFPNPVTAQLAQAEVWPPGQMILVRLLPALGAGVLYHGLRSPMQRRLWRRLQRSS